jgi:hypothetical protein
MLNQSGNRSLQMFIFKKKEGKEKQTHARSDVVCICSE